MTQQDSETETTTEDALLLEVCYDMERKAALKDFSHIILEEIITIAMKHANSNIIWKEMMVDRWVEEGIRANAGEASL